MNLNEYQQLASRTLPERGEQNFFAVTLAPEASVAHKLLRTRENKSVDLLHAILGLTGEVGELADPIKRAMFYGTPLDEANLREEAGDILWYIAGPLCRALGCTLEELASDNIAKLQKRYPDKYTNAAAVARADKTPPTHADKLTPKDLIAELAITPALRHALVSKYGPCNVDYGDGTYWDNEDKCWRVCPELHTPGTGHVPR